MDYAILYDPIYAALGVDAVLTPPDSGGADTVRVIFKAPKVDAFGAAHALSNHVGVSSIAPLACVRATEFAAKGFTRAIVDGGTLVISGKTWTIKFNDARPPPPTGEAEGEIELILSE